MACRIDILQNLTDEINQKAIGIEGAQWKTAQEIAKNINASYKADVVKVLEGPNDYTNKVVIDVPSDLVDRYYDHFSKIEEAEKANDILEASSIQAEDAIRAGEEFDKDYMFQQDNMPVSEASPETISLMKRAAEKMGIVITTLNDYLKGNPDVKVNGVTGLADAMQKVVAIATGKENVALTEEVVHVATAMLEQTHPELITQMISKIGRFEIYKQTLKEYRDNKHYQLPDGKPDIRKIKKEAADKLISEMIVNNSEGTVGFPELQQEVNRSWIRNLWNKFMDTIKGIYRKSNVDVFQEVAKKVSEGNIEGQAVGEHSVYLQELSNPQKLVQEKILATQKSLEKFEEEDSELSQAADDSSNYYVLTKPDGTKEKVLKRVTDRVKSWYSRKFGNKEFTEQEKKFNEFKRVLGVLGHSYFEEIHGRYFNPDGTRKTSVDARPTIPREMQEAYNIMEKYYTELVASFSKDGNTPLVFSEVKVYDPKEKEAGTLDLLIVEQTGKGHLFDWKFMTVSDKSADVPWFKQEAYQIQLGRYRDMLLKGYGVTSLGMSRAIPILMDTEKIDEKNINSNFRLKGINIGSVDVSKIKSLKLLPVSHKAESTRYKSLDKALVKLNAVLGSIARQNVTNEDERQFKNDRLNLLKEAIRYAQTQEELTPLIDVITKIREEGDNLRDDWETIYANRPATDEDIRDIELSDFADQLREYKDIAEAFSKMHRLVGELIYSPKMDKEAKTEDQKADLQTRKDILKELKDESEAIDISRDEVIDIIKQFGDKFIGVRHLETGFLNPEPILRGLRAMFGSITELPNTSLRLLNKLMTDANLRASREAVTKVERLLKLKDSISARGGNIRNIVQQLYQKDANNKLVNKLIYKYSKSFYEEIEANSKKEHPSRKWLEANIDLEAYQKEADEIMNRRILKYKNDYRNDEETQDRFITEEKKKWMISRKDFNGWNNYVLRRHPLDKHLSEEYKKIQADPELFELYNLIIETNDIAKEEGYISNMVANTFLPYVQKGLAEKLAWGSSISEIMSWQNSMTIHTEDSGYGHINELTGEYEHSIPKYYTYDITKHGGLVSEDLFKNMVLYIKHVEHYKQLRAIEGQVDLIKTIEGFKDHLETNRIGNVISENGRPKVEPGNIKNTDVFDKFMRVAIYGEKYAGSDSDIAIDIHPVEFVKKLVNSVAGKTIYETKENPDPYSLTKVLDTINSWFRVKTLGGNLVSGAAVYFGSNVQVAAQSGKYFTAKEFLRNTKTLLSDRLLDPKEREKFLGFVQTFMAMREDVLDEKLRKAGMSALTNSNLQHKLMSVISLPSEHVEKSIFATLLENTMVEDGKFVNIREFVKNKYKDERFQTGTSNREVNIKIAQEIVELQKTKSIDSISSIEDGKLVIPGMDMTNLNELNRLTILTRSIARTSTHGRTSADINQASMNIWLNSMMVFKTWMPKLLITRFSGLEKIADDFSVKINEDSTTSGEKYDIGRINLLFHVWGSSIVDRSTHIINIIKMNDKGISKLDSLFDEYSADYERRTGNTFNMTREDFFDMIRNNLQNEVRELGIMLGLMSALLTSGFVAPGNDDKATKNSFNYGKRVINKFVEQLSLFYNPAEFGKILSGGMFPALGIFTDINNFASAFIKETTGYDITHPELSAEEVQKRAQPSKYALEIFPLGKAAITYMSMLDSEFAKDFNVTVNEEVKR